MAKKNWVKDFLESSPWALGIVAVGAVSTFLITAVDSGLRVYERYKVTSQGPSIEIFRQGGFIIVPVTATMKDIPAIQNLRKLAGLFVDGDPNQLPLWPVELLVLNPTKESISLHSCKMLVRIPTERYDGVKYLIEKGMESTGYFVSNNPSLMPESLAKPIVVAAQEVKRIQLFFTFMLLERVRAKPLPESEKIQRLIAKPVKAEITCSDPARHEYKAITTLFEELHPVDRAREDEKWPIEEKAPSKKPRTSKSQ